MIWGCLLLLAGVGVFLRIPKVIPQIEQIESFSTSVTFIRLCFYLLGCLLICGGIKKIHGNFKSLLARGKRQDPKA